MFLVLITVLNGLFLFLFFLFLIPQETLEAAVGASVVEISPGDAAAAAAGPSKSEVKQLKEEMAALQKVVSCRFTFFFLIHP